MVRRVTVVGLASGLFNTAQQLASSIGLAVLASLAATQTEALIGSGHSTRDALASGYGRGFLCAAICVLVALALAAILLPRPPADQTSRESPGRVMRSSPYSRVPVSEPQLTPHHRGRGPTIVGREDSPDRPARWRIPHGSVDWDSEHRLGLLEV